VTDISPKVLAGGFGAAVATVFWTIATMTFWKGTFTAEQLTALTGSTAVVISVLLGYLIRDPARTPIWPATPPPPNV
jgi:hypothetical protein